MPKISLLFLSIHISGNHDLFYKFVSSSSYLLFGTESDCILHGYIKKLGGPFASAWQTRYAKLYPNRLELHPESGSTKPELIFMDQIEDVSADLVHVKNEQCIVVRTRDGKNVLTNPVGLIISCA